MSSGNKTLSEQFFHVVIWRNNVVAVVVILFPEEYNVIHSVHTTFHQFHKCIPLAVPEKLNGSSSWQPLRSQCVQRNGLYNSVWNDCIWYSPWRFWGLGRFLIMHNWICNIDILTQCASLAACELSKKFQRCHQDARCWDSNIGYLIRAVRLKFTCCLQAPNLWLFSGSGID